MDVIYLDSLFGLNLLIDYCLVLASARVCGVVLRRWRYALAALIGALYAALMVLPGCGWLANGAMKLALGAAMALIAFGGEAHLARCTVVFFAVSAAFGGAVYAASMLAGVSPGSGALVTVSGRVLALSFAACYAAVSLVFRRRAKAADREVRTVTVTLAGRSVTLKALRDSGNDLHDPVSGLPAAVVERAAVLPLFPALHALPDDAVQTLEALSALPECTGRVVLLPYRAVGVAGALLPAFRPDSVRIDGMPEPMLLALSAQALTSDGAFAMVLPPKKLRRGFRAKTTGKTTYALGGAAAAAARQRAGAVLHRRERHHARPARPRGRAAGYPGARRRERGGRFPAHRAQPAAGGVHRAPV